MKRNIRALAIAGLLIALDIVSARFLCFYTPGQTDRISMQFAANGVAGALFGPVFGAVISALGDIVGVLINPAGMSFMPLITLACAARGLIYGLVLYRREVSLWRCLTAVALVTLVVELGLMPWFLSMLYERGYSVVLLSKLPWRLATIPVYGSVLFAVLRGLKSAGYLKAVLRKD